MPTTEISKSDFTDGKIAVLDLMLKAGLIASKGEGRRLIQQGGVTVNDVKVTDVLTEYTESDFTSDFILKKGKKSFNKFVIA